MFNINFINVLIYVIEEEATACNTRIWNRIRLLIVNKNIYLNIIVEKGLNYS
jgi:hypothetical protein